MAVNGYGCEIDHFMASLIAKDPWETTFHQAVQEVVRSVYPVYIQDKTLWRLNILRRIVEPNRSPSFKVIWMDDQGNVNVNRGYRVEFNGALGPFKGGLRFHPSVNLDILKFLGFEQVFKNSLTGLLLGAGKGGSDFDPKGKSENEIMRFCQAFMFQLHKYLGDHTDVPAGDIGVGSREIGYMFGAYRVAGNGFDSGVITGKGIEWGGSYLRPEATGYGLVYFVVYMLGRKLGPESLTDKIVAVSGSGNVAQYAAEKVIQFGGKVITLSDSNGTIYDSAGIDREKLDFVMELKNNRRGRIREYASQFAGVEYYENKSPWEIAGSIMGFHIALPCAAENEINRESVLAMVCNKLECVAEGANMPLVPDAVNELIKAKILYGPGKAANAGGVAVSGLEMAQNSAMSQWPRRKVDKALQKIMCHIHERCVEYGRDSFSGFVNYVDGANIAGFLRVARAMRDQGVA